MIAYHGDSKIKETYLQRVRAHRAADELIHGQYWTGSKGCAVGCTVHSSDHSAYETELGIPSILARLEDGIFESLPENRAQEWPEKFLSTIETGANLELVWPKFAVWLMIDGQYGVINFAKNEKSKTAIKNVADAYQLIIDSKAGYGNINWRRLRSYAYAAAAAGGDYAAGAATYAACSGYAYAYGTYGTYGTDAGTDAATAAVTAYAAAARNQSRSIHRIAQSEKLLELLSAAPVAASLQ